MPLKIGSFPKVIAAHIWTEEAAIFALTACAIFALTACAIARPVDVALAGQPPAKFQGDITTVVEWRSAEAAGLRCAALQARFGQFPTGTHGCAFAEPGGPITLVLPRDLHPLISHELGHAHQLAKGEPVTHREYK